MEPATEKHWPCDATWHIALAHARTHLQPCIAPDCIRAYPIGGEKLVKGCPNPDPASRRWVKCNGFRVSAQATGFGLIAREDAVPQMPTPPPLAPASVPKVAISSEVAPPALPKQPYDPEARYQFHYEASEHREAPHIVKFSGGRSSGMLLFILLENGFLKRERGDVVIFNNTSAEHPETYRFVAECKRIVEQHYGIPFFWIEFQTYEDVRSGNWTRLPSYRLVASEPRSATEPNGYHWRGEVFEEMLSHAVYMPNIHTRTCTKHMKLGATQNFLRDWLACKEEIPRQGHHGTESRQDDEGIMAQHKRHRGKTPADIRLKKKAFVRQCPVSRPAQRFEDFSLAFRTFDNPALHDKHYGGIASDEAEYTAFLGLRADEEHRIARVKARNAGPDSSGQEEEHLYTLLGNLGVSRQDVNEFWRGCNWGLQLPTDVSLSNCVYCFLKGQGNLQQVHTHMQEQMTTEMKDTPSDIDWWRRMENTYGRDLKAEKRNISKEMKRPFVGFFGSGGFSYELLATDGGRSDASPDDQQSLDCHCTD